MAYAEKTTVSTQKSKADIEEMLLKHGADQFISGFKGNIAIIGFTMSNRQIRFVLPLPDRNEPRFLYTQEQHRKRTDEAAYKEWQQACKSKWRSLYLIVKAKLEAVESGISTIEREFFYDIVLPNGKTAGELIAPEIQTAYETGKMPSMLPLLE